MFGMNKEEGGIVPQIKMFDLAPDNPNSGADLTIKKTGYVRVHDKLGTILDLGENDWIVFGQFGSSLLIAKRPEGAFGHVTLKQRAIKRSKSWYGTSKKVATEIGEANYDLDDEVPVEDNDVKWFKLKQKL